MQRKLLEGYLRGLSFMQYMRFFADRPGGFRQFVRWLAAQPQHSALYHTVMHARDVSRTEAANVRSGRPHK
jgi:hypothetical protein